MHKLTSNEIRNMWFNFFRIKNHKIVESESLIPVDDNSLLFINAGVATIKKYFDGTVIPDNKRIASIQKCIRTNDIDNVGLTKRHLTFFEMMGNFSVGDYFKEEALEYAYEFLTSPEWANIPKSKIYVTVYTNDDEAYNKWVSLGLEESHIVRLDGNFWEIGEGPCGPDSEIFFDRGEKYDKDGTALEKFKKDVEQERFVEIWNNVFSQFNSKEGVKRENYQELPSKNIDTGAGLERWCLIFQDVDSIYETDLFMPIIKKIEDLSGRKYNEDISFKVIADHIRTITMALSDGGSFSNTGRGYVLRRLLRRSVRMGKKLGINEPFIYKLVDTVSSIMSDAYKNVEENKGMIKTFILQEEELFHKTLSAGERKLYELMEESVNKTISGYDVFKLYDTYGFPYELTLEYLEENGFTTKRDEFDKYMNEAKKLAKENMKKDANMNIQNEALLKFDKASLFSYDDVELVGKVIYLFDGEKEVEQIDDKGYIIFDKTCFYAESGGQVADIGAIKNDKMKAKVLNVLKTPNGAHLHYVELLEGSIKKNDLCTMKIMEERRKKIAKNHSAVHLIQKTLKSMFNAPVNQAGSYVDDHIFRFDFTYTGRLNDDKIIEVENLANERVNKAVDSKIEEMKLEDAKKKGAIALFSEKYKDIVRVVELGDSLELCGGTHVKNTKDIGRIAILKYESKGSNLYRIEGTTDTNIEHLVAESTTHYLKEIEKLLSKAKQILEKAKEKDLDLDFDIVIGKSNLSSFKDVVYNKNQLAYVKEEVRKLEKNYKKAKSNYEGKNVKKYLESLEEVNNKKLIILEFNDFDTALLKEIADNLINEIKEGLVFIVNKHTSSMNFICRSSIDIDAGFLIKKVSNIAGANGGGSKTFAQGGGRDITKLNEVLEVVRSTLKGD